MFASTSNEDASVIPFVQWVQAPDRDGDLAYWNPMSGSPINVAHLTTFAAQPSSAERERLQWANKSGKAVFRGSLHRLSVYSDQWRSHGPQRTPVTNRNWDQLGRTALLAARFRRPDLLDVRLSTRSMEAREGLDQRLAINSTLWAQMDRPDFMSLNDQAARFRYAVNVEGHGGWADRGGKLLLQPQAMLQQDMPARPWYFLFLRAYRHFIPVDSNLANVTDGIMWARDHETAAKNIAIRANRAMRELLHPQSMYYYMEALLVKYAQLLKYQPAMHKRAVRFRCLEMTKSRRSCNHRALNDSLKTSMVGETSMLGETSCFFTAAGADESSHRYHTLYEASVATLRDDG